MGLQWVVLLGERSIQYISSLSTHHGDGTRPVIICVNADHQRRELHQLDVSNHSRILVLSGTQVLANTTLSVR
jgi:hypothetical protein